MAAEVSAIRASNNAKTSIPDAEAFRDSLKGLPPGERVARVKEVMKQFAKEQGWEKDRKISKLNGRDVYKQDKNTFWGVDTEKGTLEKVNGRGEHQGEFNIEGRQVGPRDPKGGHDLEM